MIEIHPISCRTYIERHRLVVFMYSVHTSTQYACSRLSCDNLVFNIELRSYTIVYARNTQSDGHSVRMFRYAFISVGDFYIMRLLNTLLAHVSMERTFFKWIWKWTMPFNLISIEMYFRADCHCRRSSKTLRRQYAWMRFYRQCPLTNR